MLAKNEDAETGTDVHGTHCTLCALVSAGLTIARTYGYCGWCVFSADSMLTVPVSGYLGASLLCLTCVSCLFWYLRFIVTGSLHIRSLVVCLSMRSIYYTNTNQHVTSPVVSVCISP